MSGTLDRDAVQVAQTGIDVTAAELLSRHLPRRILYGSGLLSRKKHCQSSLIVEEDTINSFHLSLSTLSIGLIDMIKIIRDFIITNHKYK